MRALPLLAALALLAPAAMALVAPLAPAFQHFVSPFAGKAGETSIGVNPRTNSVFFQRLLHTDRVTWDGAGQPTWTNVSPDLNNDNTNDPILYTDPASGRTFVVHLRAPVGSVITFTDDDGTTWLPGEPATVFPAFDHETLGGGPYGLPAGLTNPVYPSQLFYCAQLAVAQCARSDDGGLTWGPAVPINPDLNCGGLHGHVIAGPDGTVYVPNKNCGAGEGVLVSHTFGLNWHTVFIPNTDFSRSDPVIAFDNAEKAYIGMADAGHPKVSWSTDSGEHWSDAVDVGGSFGIENTEFPMMVAGDAGRAALAFYGTTTPGNDQAGDFLGAWHVYVATTVDGGATWTTVDTTPGDPVQRGCIWLAGGSNPCRNLLDFQGAAVDAEGRVLVGYADGCVSAACLAPGGQPGDSHESIGVIARQSDGLRMYAAFDP